MRDCVIYDNTANDVGGGLSLNTNNFKLTLTKCNISSNFASNSGGGFNSDSYNTNMTMKDCFIYNNTAVGNGGGMFYTSNDYVNIFNSFISDNKANSGGGVYAKGPSRYFLFSESKMLNNVAKIGNGGGLYVGFKNDYFLMVGAEISGNKAAANGGGYVHIYYTYVIARRFKTT
jgi:hypothetical protein